MAVPYTPFGRFVHVPPPLPRSDWEAPAIPWWLDNSQCIGKLSKKTRKIKIINTLTKEDHILEVCSEETVSAIQNRYLTSFNSHAKSYMWKRLGTLIDMSQNLEANSIKDESDLFEKVGMNLDDYLPAIHLYFR